MSTFSCTDSDFGLPAELEEIRLQVRRFASEQIAPRAAEIDRSNQFPRDLWPALVGLLGVTAGALRGAALGYLAHDHHGEISRARSVGPPTGACPCEPAVPEWPDAQRERYLPRLSAANTLGARCPEPGAGWTVPCSCAPSSAAGYRPRAQDVITNGPDADVPRVRRPRRRPARHYHLHRRRGTPAGTAQKLDKLGMRLRHLRVVSRTACRHTTSSWRERRRARAQAGLTTSA